MTRRKTIVVQIVADAKCFNPNSCLHGSFIPEVVRKHDVVVPCRYDISHPQFLFNRSAGALMISGRLKESLFTL